MTYLRYLVLTTTCLILTSSLGQASDFGARQYPFFPSLIHNTRPPLCQALLKSAKNTFFSKDPYMSIKIIQGAQLIEWQEVSEAEPSEALGRLHRLDLELGKPGKKQTVIWSEKTWFTGRGTQDVSEVVFFSSPLDFRVWLKSAKDVEEPFKGAQAIPSGLGVEHKIFRFQDKYYYVGSEQIDREATINELKEDGTTTLVCKVQMAPQEDFNFSALSGIKSWLDRLRTMGIAGGGNCGSAHSEDYHNAEREEAVWRAAVRPWATSSAGTFHGSYMEGAGYYVYNQRLLQFLEKWKYQEVWNFREYQTFQHHIPPAKEALSHYL